MKKTDSTKKTMNREVERHPLNEAQKKIQARVAAYYRKHRLAQEKQTSVNATQTEVAAMDVLNVSEKH